MTTCIKQLLSKLTTSADGSTGVYNLLGQLHTVLMTGGSGSDITKGALAVCSKAHLDERRARMDSVYDDRQYYDQVTGWHGQYLVLQAKGG